MGMVKLANLEYNLQRKWKINCLDCLNSLSLLERLGSLMFSSQNDQKKSASSFVIKFYWVTKFEGFSVNFRDVMIVSGFYAN